LLLLKQSHTPHTHKQTNKQKSNKTQQEMGGPCYVVRSSDGQRVRGPPATDNFQYIRFVWRDREWMSVEQAFQAAKFPDLAAQERVRLSLKRYPSESDSAHGNHMWELGRAANATSAEWDRDKVLLMREICLAKATTAAGEAGDELRAQLLATGSDVIEGQPSTAWTHPILGPQNWSFKR
jgi:predicted NAD-dependent protein-ADP-ribosyltransferase YbiA (DUF1768 family)